MCILAHFGLEKLQRIIFGSNFGNLSLGGCPGQLVGATQPHQGHHGAKLRRFLQPKMLKMQVAYAIATHVELITHVTRCTCPTHASPMQHMCGCPLMSCMGVIKCRCPTHASSMQHMCGCSLMSCMCDQVHMLHTCMMMLLYSPYI